MENTESDFNGVTSGINLIVCLKWQKGINRGLWNICNSKNKTRLSWFSYLFCTRFLQNNCIQTISRKAFFGLYKLQKLWVQYCPSFAFLYHTLLLGCHRVNIFPHYGKLHLNFHPSVSFKHNSAYFSSLRKMLEVSSPCLLTPTVTLIELWGKDKSLNFFLYHHPPIINFIWYVYLTVPH